MDEIKGNPSTRRPLKIMIGQQVDIYFNLLENDEVATSYTGWTWRFRIMRYPGDRKSVVDLTLNHGLTYEIYSDVVLRAHLSSTQTTIEEGEYYFKLERTDIEKPVVDGVCYATFDTK